MRILVDLDGVCYSFTDALRDWVEHYEGIRPSPPADWSFYRDWGLTGSQFRTICDTATDSGYLFREGPPLPGTVETLLRLQADGHTIHLVTARDFGTRYEQNTREWLTEHRIPHDSLTFSTDKTVADVHVAVDDHPGNVDQLRAAGVAAFLAPHDWQFVRGDQRGHPLLLRSWADFERAVREQITMVGISGYARSGKDTVSGILKQHGFRNASFAAALKDAALAADPIIPVGRVERVRLFNLVDRVGWERAKDEYPEVRQFLQRFGTEAGRAVIDDNVWVDTALRRLTPGRWVFADVRFPNEADAIRQRGGEVWRIDRPGFGPVNDHPSETALDDFDFDRRIKNDGTVADLEAAIQEIAAELENPTAESKAA